MRTDERGETLLELLMTVVIMGITVVAIVGGISTSILMSDAHRKQSTAGAAVRDYGEAVEKYLSSGANRYTVGCAASASPSPYRPTVVGFTPPAGYTAAVTQVQFWSPSTTSWKACSSGDV